MFPPYTSNFVVLKSGAKKNNPSRELKQILLVLRHKNRGELETVCDIVSCLPRQQAAKEYTQVGEKLRCQWTFAVSVHATKPPMCTITTITPDPRATLTMVAFFFFASIHSCLQDTPLSI